MKPGGFQRPQVAYNAGRQAEPESYLVAPEMSAVQPSHFRSRFRPLTRSSFFPPNPRHNEFAIRTALQIGPLEEVLSDQLERIS
jgi:hypothetical protein